jgi:hypothetical protein
MRKIMKKRVIATLTVLAVLVSAVSAYAYWTTTGSGSGSATVGTTSPWAVTVGTPTGGALTPGGPTDTVSYSVKNNSTGNQKFNQVVISVANSDGSAWTAVPGCSASDFSINGAAAGAPATDASQAFDLAAGASASGAFTIQMVDSATNQNACKGVTVPLYVSAS